MTFLDYKTALVTGASAGIGATIVETLRRNNLDVHAVARRSLDRLAARTGCIPHSIDVTDTAALRDLVAPLNIDVLVNNAGINRNGSLADGTEGDIDDVVDVNLVAVLQLLHLVLPGMKARDRGHVVNIGSISGIHAFAGNATYAATKAGIHALSRQLRLDVSGKRVRVTEICPGRTETEIFGLALGDPDAARKTFFDGYETLQPQDVADAVAYAIAAPAHVNVGLIEIMPTLQVPGGMQFTRRPT